MDIRDIVEKYRNGDYTHHIKYGNKVAENYVFDEELSVRRNREMVAEHNARVKAERDAAYAKQAELDRKLTHDVTCYITENYNVNYQVASKIERFCYEHWHSNVYDYLSQIDTIADFVEDILSAMKDTSRCNKCVNYTACSRDKDREGNCKDYKRDAPDGGYYG